MDAFLIFANARDSLYKSILPAHFWQGGVHVLCTMYINYKLPPEPSNLIKQYHHINSYLLVSLFAN